MCGILVAMGVNKSQMQFGAALNLLTHRGPDHQGIVRFDDVFLGHTRLSIIDTSSNAHQPMNLRDKYSLVFNGEIYNFRELREELRTFGCQFETNSDTEVLLHGYSVWKHEVLEKLDGMFAFCLYDIQEKRIFVARDHIGIKPLFFSGDEGFILSSEIKSILELSSFKRKLNRSIIPGYFAHRYSYGIDTFFSGIQTFPPGHYAYINGNKIKFSKWWKLNKTPSDPDVENNFESEISNQLQRSVNAHTVSDVPISTYLSGGVDSSAVTKLAAQLRKEKIKAFTIGFANRENYRNEFSFSEIVAQDPLIDLEKILYCDESYLHDCRELTRFKDAPLGIPNEPLLYAMSKKVSKYAKVVLSGEGADELYGGYGRIFGMALDVEHEELLIQNRATELSDGYKLKLLENRVQRLLNNYRYVSLGQIYNLFNEKELVDEYDENMSSLVSQLFIESERASYFDQIRYFFLNFHVQGLLQRVDNCSMATSLEARVPFLSRSNINLAWSIPPSVNYKTNTTGIISQELYSEEHNIPKFALKKSLEGLLDKSVLYRKKEGFPVPLLDIIAPHFQDISKKLSHGAAVQLGVINSKYIQELLSEPSCLRTNARLVWFLYSFELFMDEYF